MHKFMLCRSLILFLITSVKTICKKKINDPDIFSTRVSMKISLYKIRCQHLIDLFKRWGRSENIVFPNPIS